MIETVTIMSTALSQNLPEPLLSVRTRPLFVLREAVPPLIVVGQTPNAFRRIGVIQGGSFKGDRLSGEVVTGNDWQAVRTDSCIKLDVRLVLKTTDGELIVMTYTCLARRSAERYRETGQGRARRSRELLFPDESDVRDQFQEIRLDEPHHRDWYREPACRRPRLQHL